MRRLWPVELRTAKSLNTLGTEGAIITTVLIPPWKGNVQSRHFQKIFVLYLGGKSRFVSD